MVWQARREFWRLLAFSAAIVLLAGAGWSASFFLRHENPYEQYDASRRWKRPIGLTEPKFTPAAEVELDDQRQVLGLLIQDDQDPGRTYAVAYLLDEMSHPATHLIRHRVAGQWIIASYCDRNRCARVFEPASPSLEEVQQIGVVGWDGKHQELLLSVQGRTYRQTDVPLKQRPAQITTWGEWKSAHPETRIYVGPPRSTLVE